MTSDKDRFGEKLRDKEKGNEEAYFARRDRELMAGLRNQAGEAPLCCPRCEVVLEARREAAGRFDACPRCGGAWLEAAVLEPLRARAPRGWLARLFGARNG